MRNIDTWWPRMPRPGNFGDILTPIIIKKLYGYHCKYVPKPFTERTLLGIGSIISRANENCTVWGSGLITSKGKLHPDANYLSVRGPRTYARMKELGIDAPAIFGDPALLLPRIYHPKNIHQGYEYGIFAHYVDTRQAYNWYQNESKVLVINPLNKDPFKVAKYVLQCKNIISSSLHGIIAAHSYGIPAVWVKHSDKLTGDDVKFHDYYESVNLKAECIDFQERIPVEDFEKFNYQVDIDINTDEMYMALRKYLHGYFK